MILTIVLSVLAAWLLVSVLLALVIGRAIRLADKDHRRKVAYRATPTAPRATAPRATAPRARAAS